MNYKAIIIGASSVGIAIGGYFGWKKVVKPRIESAKRLRERIKQASPELLSSVSPEIRNQQIKQIMETRDLDYAGADLVWETLLVETGSVDGIAVALGLDSRQSKIDTFLEEDEEDTNADIRARVVSNAALYHSDIKVEPAREPLSERITELGRPLIDGISSGIKQSPKDLMVERASQMADDINEDYFSSDEVYIDDDGVELSVIKAVEEVLSEDDIDEDDIEQFVPNQVSEYTGENVKDTFDDIICLPYHDEDTVNAYLADDQQTRLYERNLFSLAQTNFLPYDYEDHNIIAMMLNTEWTAYDLIEDEEFYSVLTENTERNSRYTDKPLDYTTVFDLLMAISRHHEENGGLEAEYTITNILSVIKEEYSGSPHLGIAELFFTSLVKTLANDVNEPILYFEDGVEPDGETVYNAFNDEDDAYVDKDIRVGDLNGLLTKHNKD